MNDTFRRLLASVLCAELSVLGMTYQGCAARQVPVTPGANEFSTVVGGLKAFGAVGLFVGPRILPITVALFTFLREERRAGPWRPWSLQLYSQPGYESLDEVSSVQPKK